MIAEYFGMEDKSRFVFTTCQVGAEGALKRELSLTHPYLRLAFSRQGFLTFKVPDDRNLSAKLDLRSTFARACGLSLGRITTDDPNRTGQSVKELLCGKNFDHVHIWRRDSAVPGENGFEPGTSSFDPKHAERIISQIHATESTMLPTNQIASPNQKILDCVSVEQNEWWLGFHDTSSVASRWPGGVCPVTIPEHAVSRAFLKMEEALQWSLLPIDPGDVCAEIGSAPGGGAQVLLERGLRVIGIDPADIAQAVLAHPNFRHIRQRGHEVKRREFHDVRWLVADAIIAPWQLLDTVESIVRHKQVHIRGMLLTLKLFDWNLAEQIPGFLDRVRSWGFSYVKARQLAFNRQEICLFALRRRALRRVT